MMYKTSSLKAKLTFFAPPKSDTSGLGGSSLNNNENSKYNFTLHLLCDVCYKLFDEEIRKPYLMVPCGHPVCMRCSNKMSTSKCPTCRARITQKVINWGLLIFMKEKIPGELSVNKNEITLNRPKTGKIFEKQAPALQKQQQPQGHVIKNWVCFKTINKHNWSVVCVKLINNKQIASGSMDNTVNIWNIDENNNFQCVKTLTGHTEYVNCLELINDFTLASGSSDSTIRLWNLTTYSSEIIKTGLKNSVGCLKLLSSNLIASGSKKFVHIWNTITLSCVFKLNEHTDCVSQIEMLFNGHLTSSSLDKTIKIWDLSEFKCLATLTGHEGAIKCLCTITNNRLASGSNDKTIRIWSMEDYECVGTLKGHTSSVNSLLLLSNNRLASSSSDWSIKIWCLSDLDLMLTINGHTYAVNCLESLPNNWIVSGSSDWSLKVWKEEF